MTDLDDLAQARRDLQDLVLVGEQSVKRFYDSDQRVFAVTDDERKRGVEADPDQRSIRRITTTITCLEAMLDAPKRTWSVKDREWAEDHLASFTAAALASPDDWRSENAARVYCRVRTLGSMLRLQPDLTKDRANAKAVKDLLAQAWESREDNGASFGLREATEEEPSEWKGQAQERHYPPNAYLTYWGLLANAGAGTKAGVKEPLANAATDWLTRSLGIQIALASSGSRQADPQQLAWSLCGLVRFNGDRLLKSNSTEWELLHAGMRAFFDQQDDRGEWDRGEALFHYPKAGNAYCYVYETLGELLNLATTAEAAVPSARTLQVALRPYLPKLLITLERVKATRQLLEPAKPQGPAGWSSGHHPHRTSAESWATASVYRFMHALRRLFGNWANEEAKRMLGARRPRRDMATLADRGGTWSLGRGSAGAQLSTLFVHPIAMAEANRKAADPFLPDPDEKIFVDTQARSAMLFGPPGTGKTTLVEAVAGALGWDFIEITPAQFLDEGVDRVSAHADEIFRHVMELNRCVILLDEIDELVRKRGSESEPLERFFTTTMLPRLAKLWDLGRVLFFANTNGIADVDSAIRRSQRFDALVLVLPPGHAKKTTELAKRDLSVNVTEEAVNKILTEDRSDQVSTPLILGWYGLLRHDQLGPLAEDLKASIKDGKVDDDVLATHLQRYTKDLSQLDWEGRPGVDSGSPPDLRTDKAYERRDSRMEMFARLLDPDKDDDTAEPFAPVGLDVVETQTGRYVRMTPTPDDPEAWARQHHMVMRPDGVVGPK